MKKLSLLLARSQVLFFIVNIVSDESLDSQRQSLLGLAISSRHYNYYSWLLTQSYSALTKNMRR